METPICDHESYNRYNCKSNEEHPKENSDASLTRYNSLYTYIKLLKTHKEYPTFLFYECQVTKGNTESWLNYMKFADQYNMEFRYVIYRRAVCACVDSYWIWKKYLKLLLDITKTDDKYSKFVDYAFKESIVYIFDFPELQFTYSEYLALFPNNSASIKKHFSFLLQVIPITQHESLLWPRYLSLLKKYGDAPLEVNAYCRYVQLNSKFVNNLIDLLIDKYDSLTTSQVNYCFDLFLKYISHIDNEHFVSIFSNYNKFSLSYLLRLSSYYITVFNEINLQLIATVLVNKISDIYVCCFVYYCLIVNCKKIESVKDCLQSFFELLKAELTTNQLVYPLFYNHNELLDILDKDATSHHSYLKELCEVFTLRMNITHPGAWLKYINNVFDNGDTEELTDIDFTNANRVLKEGLIHISKTNVTSYCNYITFLIELYVANNYEVESLAFLDKLIQENQTNVPLTVKLSLLYAELLYAFRSDKTVYQYVNNFCKEFLAKHQYINLLTDMIVLCADLEFSLGLYEEFCHTVSLIIRNSLCDQSTVSCLLSSMMTVSDENQIVKTFEQCFQSKYKNSNELNLFFLCYFISLFGESKHEYIRVLFSNSMSKISSEDSVYFVYLRARFEFDYGFYQLALNEIELALSQAQNMLQFKLLCIYVNFLLVSRGKPKVMSYLRQTISTVNEYYLPCVAFVLVKLELEQSSLITAVEICEYSTKHVKTYMQSQTFNTLDFEKKKKFNDYCTSLLTEYQKVVWKLDSAEVSLKFLQNKKDISILSAFINNSAEQADL